MMEKFFIGMHHECYAWPFRNVMISVNTLRRRKSDFNVNDWIMDSGAFSQLFRSGRFTMGPSAYLAQIERWRVCGRFLGAVCQDWMCEPFILQKTGKSVAEHQDLTIRSYIWLKKLSTAPIIPVLQGFKPSDYVKHIKAYGELLHFGKWVGVGSVCKRNGNPDAIEDVLMAIKSERPDLMLHGFGLKVQALERATIRDLLHSSDSMAWSYAGRREQNDSHDPRAALKYAASIEAMMQHPTFVQEQLFKWWA
jgi:hypothetical protein